VHLIFVNSLGRHYTEQVKKMVSLTSPIIEDDGQLMALFDAEYDDTIIIGADFRIKFKYNRIDKEMIYQEIMRNTRAEVGVESSVNPDTMTRLMHALCFRNLRTNKLEKLKDFLANRKTLLNLLISPCFSCPETKRFSIIREVAEKSDTQVILLFGSGNGMSILREYMERAGLDIPGIIAGVIEEDTDLLINKDSYYRIFKYDIDPRTLILDRRGSIIFLERPGEDSKISSEFLIKKIHK